MHQRATARIIDGMMHGGGALLVQDALHARLLRDMHRAAADNGAAGCASAELGKSHTY
jgi:hypothetical protein